MDNEKKEKNRQCTIYDVPCICKLCVHGCIRNGCIIAPYGDCGNVGLGKCGLYVPSLED